MSDSEDPRSTGGSPGEASIWFLDELAHAGREHLDPDYVAAFDEKSSTDWTEEVETLLSLGVGSTSTVVDFGAAPVRSRWRSLHMWLA